MQSYGDPSTAFYNSVIFSKVKDVFGGRIRVMVSGSAPLNLEVHSFMQALISCPMFEGYGST